MAQEIMKPDQEQSADTDAVQRDQAILSMVASALERGDCMLAFQPIVQSQKPYHPAFYEGLIRVLDSAGRIIPAAEFMPLVEHHDIGRDIDCAALRCGIDALRRKPDLRLAINMSTRSIGHPQWTRILKHALRNDPTLGERLILEITESSAMQMPEAVMAFMQRFQAQGVTFALDDFGAGHTSFRYLKDFYFDILKIDGQFTRGVHHDANNQVLTEALIKIGRQFDMFTVAEAVETQEEADFLAKAGIDCMQGYYYGRPETNPLWLQQPEQKHSQMSA